MKRAISGKPYEHVSEPVLARPRFARRMLRSGGIGALIVLPSLLIGMLGYHFWVRLDWIDAYENAAMILSGMGPLAVPDSVAGKIFAGTYALFSGIVVLATAGVVLAPVLHRMLHRLHADR